MNDMANETESNRVTSPYTLLGSWVERSGLSWLQASFIVGLFLLMFVLFDSALTGEQEFIYFQF